MSIFKTVINILLLNVRQLLIITLLIFLLLVILIIREPRFFLVFLDARTLLPLHQHSQFGVEDVIVHCAGVGDSSVDKTVFFFSDS